MKNNDKKILKYLSEFMTDAEKDEFERELKSNEALHFRYEELKNNIKVFADTSIEHNLNENYFNSLLPKVRNRLDEKTSGSKKPAIISALASAAAVIIFIVLFDPGASNVDFSFNNYEEEISTILNSSDSEIDGLLDESYSYSYNDINIEEVNDRFYSDYVDELTSNYNNSSTFQSTDINDSYSYLDNLEDEELNKIISELKEIKFL
jgi:hypothetical protein